MPARSACHRSERSSCLATCRPESHAALKMATDGFRPVEYRRDGDASCSCWQLLTSPTNHIAPRGLFSTHAMRQGRLFGVDRLESRPQITARARGRVDKH